MNISEKEEKLFERWEKKIEGRSKGQFVPDGVVCEAAYSNLEPKIVFILKEVNDPGCSGWDLRDFLRKGAINGADTWNNVARWTYGIENRNLMPTWKKFPKMSKEERAKILKSICAINLNKMPGGGSTDHEELEIIARDDRELIQEQYETYKPDLTLCGGTRELFDMVTGHDPKSWQETSRGVPWYEWTTNKYVIAFYHPAARLESSLMLDRLIDAVNEIMSPGTS